MLMLMPSKVAPILIFLMITAYSLSAAGYLNDEENRWIADNSDKELTISFDPLAGMEYFTFNGKEYGFVPDLAALLGKSLGLHVRVRTDMTWGEAFSGLQNGKIDILLGANKTEERLKTMTFTKALYRIPYSLLARRDSEIYVIGDLERKKIGFIEGDIIENDFSRKYSMIPFTPVIYSDQDQALLALSDGKIDGFVTSGGSVIKDYIKRYPAVKEIAELRNFTSDMTLSVKNDRKILASILEKFIDAEKSEIDELIGSARQIYNYKLMDLTDDEVDWISQDGVAVAGVADGYLPFETVINGKFLGISASMLRAVSAVTGIKFKPEQGEFSTLLEKAGEGKIQILNMAKTSDREKNFFFAGPFSKERDMIYGRTDSDYVQDIYGLSGKRVAVVKGYWHKELLEKNAVGAEIVTTDSLKASMNAIMSGKADYMIENPSVINYFVQEWEYYDIVRKGMTSYNSFLYFGIPRSSPELASIVNKALKIIDRETAFQEGFTEVPHSRDKLNLLRLTALSILLTAILTVLVFFTIKQTRRLIQSRKTAENLREREEYLYRDPMTNLYNRHFLYHKVEPFIRKWRYPQTAVILDLNNLKKTNDRWGHAAGDSLLGFFGVALKDVYDKTGAILIRMGGDEFMILEIGTGRKEALERIALLEKHLAASPLILEGGRTIPLSTAWGCATRNSFAEKSFEELEREADKAMYEHKKASKFSGGN